MNVPDRTSSRSLLSTIAVVVPIGAAIVGGAWALYLYVTTQAGIPTVAVELSADTYPFTPDKRLLVVTIKPHNVGKVPAYIDEQPGVPGVGFRVSRIPPDRGLGEIPPEQLPKAFPDEFVSAKNEGIPVGASTTWTAIYVVEIDATYVASAVVPIRGGPTAYGRAVATPADPKPKD